MINEDLHMQVFYKDEIIEKLKNEIQQRKESGEGGFDNSEELNQLTTKL